LDRTCYEANLLWSDQNFLFGDTSMYTLIDTTKSSLMVNKWFPNKLGTHNWASWPVILTNFWHNTWACDMWHVKFIEMVQYRIKRLLVVEFQYFASVHRAVRSFLWLRAISGPNVRYIFLSSPWILGQNFVPHISK